MSNPTGTNSPVAFDRFTREIPYGEKRVQGDLQRTVPLAGESAASTPINLPRELGRQAQKSAEPQVAAAPAPPPLTASDIFTHLASLPGAPPIIQDYARRAIS